MPKKRNPTEDPPSRAERDCVLLPACRDDLAYWVNTDPRIASRLLRLIDEVMRTPFTGTGKPEPLKEKRAGMWSRRLTDEHRLLYIVENERISFLRARYHYDRR